MKFSTIGDGFRHIESFMNLEKNQQYTVRTYRLDRMQQLLEHFDHPERSCRTIHAAGSKGKGSTCMFIAKALKSLGYKAGLYSSPHVFSYKERFTLAGDFFSEEELLEVMQEMFDSLTGFSFPEEEGFTSPTTFELLTLLGFLLFRKAECDFAVIETGLGGRLDATNVVQPELTVITPIELEHTQILGSTYSEIAAEKAGIIKPGIPVIISAQHPDARKVLVRRAAELQAEAVFLPDALYHCEAATTLEGTDVVLHWNSGYVQQLHLRMHGNFQAENAALALLALKTLKLPAGRYREDKIAAAVSRAELPGRMDVIRDQQSGRTIIIDGAHTHRSMIKVIESYRNIRPAGGAVLFGAVRGKDHAHMAESILKEFGKIVISTPGTFKPSDPKGLFILFHELAQNMESEGIIQSPPILLYEPDPETALRRSASLIQEDEPMLVTGSFYMASEIYSALISAQT